MIGSKYQGILKIPSKLALSNVLESSHKRPVMTSDFSKVAS